MVDVVDRAWNFTVPSAGGELTLQQLQFVPESRRPPVKELFRIGMFGGPVEIHLAVQNNSGKLKPVTEKYTSDAEQEGGFAVEEVPGVGSTIAYYPSAQDEEPYYLYDDGVDGLQLMPKRLVEDLPKTAFWTIDPLEGSGNTIQNKNNTFCLQAADTPVQNQEEFNGTSPNDCGSQGFLTALRTNSADHNWHQCFGWENWKLWAGESCHRTPGHTDHNHGVEMRCHGGKALQGTDAIFPGHHHETGKMAYNYTCCTPKLPPYVMFAGDSVHGKVSWDGTNYTYSCNSLGFMTGLHWHYETGGDAHAYCSAPMLGLDPTTSSLILSTCNASLPFQQWEFKTIKDEADEASLEEDFVTLSSCEASLTIDAKLTTPRAVDLLLEIQGGRQALNPQQRQAYQYVVQYEVVKPQGNGTQVLFACQAAQFGQGKLCASSASVSPEDLATVYANAVTLTIDKVCPVLLNRSLSVDPALAKPMEPKGMTMKDFQDVMLNLPYKTVPFDNAREWPFFYNGSKQQRAQSVGYLSVPANGDAFWGVTCPAGAVVVSEEKTLPHCLDIHASASQEVFTSFSGSATCPSGSAISGWYNLPGIFVRHNSTAGGPRNWTGLRVLCRRTTLIGFCEQPSKPHCTVGHVVNAISYSENQFKVGCCRFLRPMGASLMPYGRAANPYLGFEGYYCPTEMGSTGAPLYKKTAIGVLGAPGTNSDLNYTLVWNKFTGNWLLRNGKHALYTIHSGALSPVEITGGPISATAIRPLASESQPKVKSPFPSKKPTYPKLLEFRAVQPNYAAYCSPERLLPQGDGKIVGQPSQAAAEKGNIPRSTGRILEKREL
ncbi:unnamed protein product [Symbiodinium natans]|uniref:Uncharacterized protein n=1 Tax=Symbiodinium natans TaxID=878477 RepID=A0A812P5V0_9DINO|nr:unnamed protein product [Symbiodinium natans]